MLYAHPQVLDAAVFGIPDDEWGERVHAIVQAKPGETIDLDELRAFVEPRLAAYKRPRGYEVRDALPRTDSGKLLKRVLRDEYWKDRTSRLTAPRRVHARLARPLRYPPAVPTLSEAASKQLLREYGVPVLDERTAADADAAVAAAEAIGFPVVVKLCGDAIAHKTERGLVRLGLRDDEARCARPPTQLLAAARPDDGAVELLVAPMVHGHPRAHRRPRARPAVRPVRDARRRRRARRGARRRRVPRRARSTTPTPTTLIDDLATQNAARRRSAASPRSTAPRCVAVLLGLSRARRASGPTSRRST